MAISLGAAALSFAGGVAEGINTKVDAEHKSRLRRQERAEDLKTQQKLNIQQSQYLDSVKKWEKDNAFVKQLKAAGGDHDQVQRLIADFNGLDADTLKAKQLRGDVMTPLSYTRSTSVAAPAPVGDDVAISGQRDTVGIVRKIMGVGPADPEPTTAEGKSVPEDTPKVTYGGTGTDWTLGAPDEFETREVLNPDGTKSIVRFNKRTGLPEGDEQVIGKGGKIAESPWKATVDSKTGNTTFTNALTQKTIEVEGSLGGVDDPKDALIRFQNEREVLQENIQKGKDVENNQQRLSEVQQNINKLITITGTTEHDPNSINARQVQNLENRFSATETALSNIKTLRRTSKAEAGGAPGLIASGIDFAATTVKGFAQATGFIDSKTEDQRLTELLEFDSDIKNYLDNNLAAFRSANRVAKASLLYDIAAVMRDSGRKEINASDVVRAKEMLAGLIGSDTERGSLIQLEAIVKDRQKRVARDLYSQSGIDSSQKRTFGRKLVRIHFKAGEYYWDPQQNDYVVTLGKDSNGKKIPMLLGTLNNRGRFDN